MGGWFFKGNCLRGWGYNLVVERVCVEWLGFNFCSEICCTGVVYNFFF